MKLKIVFPLFVVVCAVVGCACFFTRMPGSAVVETQGDVFTVSVYEFGKPLKFNSLYEPRDDLDEYPWLKPVLFWATDLSAYIPESEWELYWPRSWTPEKIQEQKAANEQRRKIVLENENNYYSNHHAEINELILCESKEFGRFLVVAVRVTETASGIQENDAAVTCLRMENGRWVFGAPKGPRGVDLLDRLMDCRREALEMTENRSLKARNIRCLR